MNENFRLGFDKLAYNYEHEAKNKENYAKSRKNDKAVGWKRSLGIGSAIGGGVGALAGMAGDIQGPLAKKLFGGAAVGALGGAALGALYKLFDEADIGEQKRIMAMPQKDRVTYLASAARKEEFHERESYKRMYRNREY